MYNKRIKFIIFSMRNLYLKIIIHRRNCMENKGKAREHGITLVALVITIIILLILAGVAITTLTQTGLFENAKQAKNATENAQKEENKILENYIRQTEKYLPQELPQLKDNIGKVLSQTENTKLQDENGNKVVVPAGFKVVSDDTTNNAKTVEQGIVVEDENGNQYVWIFCTTNETKTILEYKRNEWDVAEKRASKDEVTLTDAICSKDDIVNGLTTEIKNEIVEQIKKEKNSVNNYGGYYIGRYEVGNENNVAVIKKDQEPYTNIQWYKAYELAKGIGGGVGATTYLCSSYAWDTAINFIQNTGTENYATTREGFNENWYAKEVKDSLGNVIKVANEPLRLKTGKTTSKSNIFDMGGNVAEYTTEIVPGASKGIILRGGSFYSTYSPAGCRVNFSITSIYDTFGFRATLFLE